ncbi:FAS1 domain containing protein [Parasponia andersonii]|uniref:FAS1 domain containing protein n=1 Tax=Parasponia andersonii TaxID=3476 RepID=A0A2P5DEX7_PARAD|nr:FAS1 domain containing protein [Parasponia andersonii]
MTKQSLIFSLSFLCFFIYHLTTSTTLALSPAQAPSQTRAQAPAKSPTSTQPAVEPPSEVPLVQAPPHRARAAPTNVTKILDKAGGFSVFIRLLKSTSVSIQIENQLNVSNSLTIFAPTNGAFSALKPGTLNSLSTEEKVQLVQYHILPSFVSLQNFQTLSNPVRTQASNTYDFPLNITVEGSWVNISTGIVNTTISATVYEDNQLAIYKVDKVLLPLGIFAPRPKPRLAPSPSPVKPSSSSSALDSPVAALDASNGPSLITTNGLVRTIDGAVVLVATIFFMGFL